jgi:alkylation response protein AidB-like acyl-CoA dehydrogenase
MSQLDSERVARLYGSRWVETAEWYRSSALSVLAGADLQADPLDDRVRAKIEADFSATTRQRAEMCEVMAYGDAGFLLTMPGPSLSGVLINALGDEEQRSVFRRTVVERRCRTFFAVTEPERGSDAGNLGTRLTGGRLTGEKLLFGNGAVAPIGTVLARTGDGPLDTVAVLLLPEQVRSGAMRACGLDMFAMRGARLAHMRFDDLEVPEHQVLGRHLRAHERGVMGMVKTFHRFRPAVAAMAIGHAQALVDCARMHFATVPGLPPRLDSFDHALAGLRALNLAAAERVDLDPLHGAAVSLIKSRATRWAERIARALSRELPLGALFEHPWLAKSLSDTYAFEYMEGTTPVHLENVHHGYVRHELTL